MKKGQARGAPGLVPESRSTLLLRLLLLGPDNPLVGLRLLESPSQWAVLTGRFVLLVWNDQFTQIPENKMNLGWITREGFLTELPAEV